MTIDVCIPRFWPAWRGHSIRGIRLLQGHLVAAQHIRHRHSSWEPTILCSGEVMVVPDAPHIERAVAAMIDRNRATLRSVDVNHSANWDESKPIMTALSDCRNLTSLEVANDEQDVCVMSTIQTIVASNMGCLRKLAVVGMNAATLSLALRRLPLEELQLELSCRVDRHLLAGCTTLERLVVDDEENDNGDRFPALCEAIAHAAPKLTRLRQLRIDHIDCDENAVATWHFAPSLTSLVVLDSDDMTIPAIRGGSISDLKLDDCEALLVDRLVRSCCATLVTVNIVCSSSGRGRAATTLPRLEDCARLRSLHVDVPKGMCAEALLTLVAACSDLAVLHVRVDASVYTRHLGELLEATQGRLRDLSLCYTYGADTVVRRACIERVSSARTADGTDDCRSDTPMPVLHLPHLVSLRVEMCSSELLGRLKCPRLAVLDVVGARVRLFDPMPRPGLFPRLEVLRTCALAPFAAAIVVASAAAAAAAAASGVEENDDYAHLHALTLCWKHDEICGTVVGEFNGTTLGRILDRCPRLARLGFDYEVSGTPSDRILAALAEPNPRRHPSRLSQLALPQKLAAAEEERKRELAPDFVALCARNPDIPPPSTFISSSDQILASIAGVRARHPRLGRIAVDCSDEIDLRIRVALYDS